MSLTRKELLEAFAKMPSAYRDCRDFGHIWQPVNAEPIGGGNYERQFKCARCPKERYQEIDRRGYIVRSGHRKQPDDYGITGGGYFDADQRAALRMVQMQQLAGIDKPKFSG